MTRRMGSALILVLGLICAGSVGAHPRFGVYVGVPGPYWGPSYYAPAPYYYYSPPVTVVSPQPTVYVQQPVAAPAAPAAPAAAPASAAENYWYYCASGKGYYPYVKVCPGGWQRVSPTPPAQ